MRPRIEHLWHRNLLALLGRGRGTGVLCPRPVEIEPPFIPFDWDAQGADEPQTATDEPAWARAEVETFICAVSAAKVPRVVAAEQILTALRTLEAPVAFEVVGTSQEVVIQVATRAADSAAVVGNLLAHAPDAAFEKARDRLANAVPYLAAIVDVALGQYPVFQVRTAQSFSTDTLLPLLATLDTFRDDVAGMQVLLAPSRANWACAWSLAARDPVDATASSWPDVPDLPARVASKNALPLFAVALRLFASRVECIRPLAGFLSQFDFDKQFIILDDGDAPRSALVRRVVHRPGMLLSTSELAGVRLLRRPNVRESVVSEEEFTRLWEAAAPSLKPILLFAYDTGMRKREVLGLTWRQVDLREGVVRLAAGDTKTDEPRVVCLTSRVIEALRGLPRDIRSDHVFVNPETGTAWRDIRKMFRRACKKAGLMVWFHDLRRSFVTRARRSGVPESVVMRLSGHKTRSVFDRYNIVSEEDLREAVHRIETGNHGHVLDKVRVRGSGRSVAQNRKPAISGGFVG